MTQISPLAIKIGLIEHVSTELGADALFSLSPHCAVPRASEGLKPAVWSVAVVHGYYRLLTKQLNPVVYLKTEINESE